MAKLQTFDLGYGGLLRGIERGQDKADRKREREEDRIFETEQRQLDRDQQANIAILSGDIESRQNGS